MVFLIILCILLLGIAALLYVGSLRANRKKAQTRVVINEERLQQNPAYASERRLKKELLSFARFYEPDADPEEGLRRFYGDLLRCGGRMVLVKGLYTGGDAGLIAVTQNMTVSKAPGASDTCLTALDEAVIGVEQEGSSYALRSHGMDLDSIMVSAELAARLGEPPAACVKEQTKDFWILEWPGAQGFTGNTPQAREAFMSLANYIRKIWLCMAGETGQ